MKTKKRAKRATSAPPEGAATAAEARAIRLLERDSSRLGSSPHFVNKSQGRQRPPEQCGVCPIESGGWLYVAPRVWRHSCGATFIDGRLMPLPVDGPTLYALHLSARLSLAEKWDVDGVAAVPWAKLNGLEKRAWDATAKTLNLYGGYERIIADTKRLTTPRPR